MLFFFLAISKAKIALQAGYWPGKRALSCTERQERHGKTQGCQVKFTRLQTVKICEVVDHLARFIDSYAQGL